MLGAGVQRRADGAAGGRVPQPHRAVAVGAGQQLAVGAERHPVHDGRVGGQHALLLLLGQQGRDGGRGLAGGEDGPGGDGELARGHAIGAIDVEAFGGELAGQGDGMLVAGAGGVVDGDPGGGDGGQGQGQQASDHCLPPADGPPVSMATSVEEVTFGLAERWVAGGVSADPGGGVGRGLQQAAAVKVGPVAGLADPLGGGGAQPGADDPVGVGVSQPGVAQQRPGGQQRLVAEFHRAGRQGEQPFGGEGLQHRLHILGLSGALALGQLRPAGAIGGVHTLAAGGGQPHKDLPGGGLLTGRKTLIGALRAARDRALDAAGAFIVGQGDSLPGPGPPGLVEGVRQQRQHPRAGSPGLAGAHLGQQDIDQVVIDAGVRLLGWFGDRHPQLPPGHRRQQVAVLDRIGQLRVVRAPGLKVSAHTQHDQRRRCLIRAVPGGGRGVQRGDERPPLLFIGALGEQLLELVDHQQQPALQRGLTALGRGAISVPGRPGWPRQGGLPRGQGKPSRIGLQPPPNRGRIGSRQQRHPQRQLIQRRPGRGEHQAWPRRRPRRGRQPRRPDPRQHSRPQQRRLPRPRHPRHHQQPRARHVPRHPLQHLGGGRFAAEEERRVLLPEHAQPAVGGTGHRSRPRPRARGGRPDLCGRDVAAGRRHEQFFGRPGQAQRTGQQYRGVLVRGAVDAPLQVADRPRGHPCRRRQLLLGQLRLGPQLPQQPGKRKRRLLGHHPSAPHTTCPPRLPAPGRTSPAPTVRRPSHSRHVPPPQVSLHPRFPWHRHEAPPEPAPQAPGTARQGPRRPRAANHRNAR